MHLPLRRGIRRSGRRDEGVGLGVCGHSAGELAPTRRGSGRLPNHASRTSGLMKFSAAAWIHPEPPDPPGLTTSDPGRPSPLAGDFQNNQPDIALPGSGFSVVALSVRHTANHFSSRHTRVPGQLLTVERFAGDGFGADDSWEPPLAEGWCPRVPAGLGPEVRKSLQPAISNAPAAARAAIPSRSSYQASDAAPRPAAYASSSAVAFAKSAGWPGPLDPGPPAASR